MVNIVLGTHHHLKGRDELTTGCTVPRNTEEPVTINIFFFQTLTGKSEMVTRKDTNLLCKNINTQCRMMYSSEFYPWCIHKQSSVIHSQLTFLDENHNLFEKKRKRNTLGSLHKQKSTGVNS